MLQVSLKGIKLYAGHGLYQQEQVLGNHFEVDVSLTINVGEKQDWPYLDYTHIHEVVSKVFQQEEKLLEALVRHIHLALKEKFPHCDRAIICVRKLNPPMYGEVAYAEVCFEG